MKSIRSMIKKSIGPSGPILLLIVLLVSGGCSRKPADYNVVYITLDTTRSDYIDTGKGARAYTPALKRFAKKSLVFERAYSTIPQTLPAHLALLTSYFPHECGVFSNQFQYDGRFEMLQQVLKNRGYTTAGIVSLGTLAGQTGINLGFDQFLENLNTEDVFFAPAETVTHEAIRLLKELRKDKFFLFVHYSDPHSPYAPPTAKGEFNIYLDDNRLVSFNAHQGAILRQTVTLPPGAHRIRFRIENCEKDFETYVLRYLKFSNNCSPVYDNIQFSKSYYDGSHVIKSRDGKMEAEIRVTCKGEGTMRLFQAIPLLTWKAAIDYYRQEVEYMDQHVGKFIQALQKEKLLKNTIVVITGDHGEGLGERERYFGHIRYLNRQFIEIPLMIHLPGMKPKRISAPVSHISVTPTILEFLGFTDKNSIDPKSILGKLKTGNMTDHPVYAYAFKPSSNEDRMSVISGKYQCIFTKETSGTVIKEYYDFSLSQSFRRIDELASAVLLRTSDRDFNFFQKAYHHMSGAFKNRYIVKLKRSDKDIEKLKTIGYLQ
jgi:membrane-anchored protein YejM (alkaline phosphatase superfamily)